MFKVDNDTAVLVQPSIPAVGPNPGGFFFNGNPATATPSTIVDDWWLNTVQEEISATVTFSGQTLSKTDAGQLRKAINYFAQKDTGVYAVDTGSANAYAVILSPVPVSYTTGMRVSIKITNSNSGASTINVNGLGLKNIKTFAGANLPSGALIAGMIAEVRYDGTNFQLLTQIPQAPTPLPTNLAYTDATNNFTLYQNIPIYYAQVNFTSTQSVSGVSTAKVQFNNVLTDSHSLWDSTNKEYSLPFTGKFRVTGILHIVSVLNDNILLAVYKNGIFLRRIAECYFSPASSSAGKICTLSGSMTISGSLGDKISLYVRNHSSTSSTLGLDPNAGTVDYNSDTNLFELHYVGT